MMRGPPPAGSRRQGAAAQNPQLLPISAPGDASPAAVRGSLRGTAVERGRWMRALAAGEGPLAAGVGPVPRTQDGYFQRSVAATREQPRTPKVRAVAAQKALLHAPKVRAVAATKSSAGTARAVRQAAPRAYARDLSNCSGAATGTASRGTAAPVEADHRDGALQRALVLSEDGEAGRVAVEDGLPLRAVHLGGVHGDHLYARLGARLGARSAPISMSKSGWATTLWYQSGLRALPWAEAKT